MSEFINNHSQRKEKSRKRCGKSMKEPYEQVKSVFAEILNQATAGEIAGIEQALISEPAGGRYSVFVRCAVAMFRQSLDQQAPPI